MARRRRPRRRRFIRRRRRAGLVRGRMHPPVNVASPWNRVVMTTSWKPVSEGQNSLTASAVNNFLKTELGLNVTGTDKKVVSQSIEVRFLRLDIWSDPSISGSKNNYIIFSPHNFISDNALTWIEAWGTPTQPANLHYVWPRSISNYCFSDGSGKIIGLIDASMGCRYIFKMHMLWRPTAPAPKPMAEISLAGWRQRHDMYNDAEDYHVVSPTTEVVERFGTL